ncbi:MAG: class III extradiol ring-cleavage dioxygenase [Actinomycetes bacterium]
MTAKMPALYIGHGAPPLLEDPIWSGELAKWSADLPRPTAILVISAHWESAPLTLGATDPGVGLIYDFGGFAPKYYNLQYRSPGAPDLAARIKGLMGEPVTEQPNRGLDHGAYIPLMKMYPEADIPVLQMSIPTHNPEKLFEIGRTLAPLRDEGVLIIGSGFLTHGLQFLREFRIEATPPGWSVEFDLWAKEVLERGAVDELMDYKRLAPGMPYAHPTVEHFAPIFITLGAATQADVAPEMAIEGYWMGLAKRSFQVA